MCVGYQQRSYPKEYKKYKDRWKPLYISLQHHQVSTVFSIHTWMCYCFTVTVMLPAKCVKTASFAPPVHHPIIQCLLSHREVNTNYWSSPLENKEYIIVIQLGHYMAFVDGTLLSVFLSEHLHCPVLLCHHSFAMTPFQNERTILKNDWVILWTLAVQLNSVEKATNIKQEEERKYKTKEMEASA